MNKFLLITIALTLIYLWLSYAYFYYQIGIKHLPTPQSQQLYQLGEPTNPPLTYVAIGDSLTAGVGATNHRFTYPYLFAERMSQSYSVNLHNFGQPGAIIQQLQDYQIPKTIELQPQLVTILIGTNNINDFTPLSRYIQSLQEIITTLKTQTSAKIVILTIPYLGSDQVTFFPWKQIRQHKINQYNAQIKQLCQFNQIECLDLNFFSQLPFQHDPSLYSADHFHPSNQGYILWSQLINDHVHP